MKKIVMLVAFSMFAASTSFAATSITMSTDLLATTSLNGKTLYGHKTTASSSTSQIGKTSTGVSLGILTGTGGYSIVTQHKNGSKAFASSYDSTSIYSQAVTTVGTAVLTVPTTTGISDFSSWTTQ